MKEVLTPCSSRLPPLFFWVFPPFPSPMLLPPYASSRVLGIIFFLSLTISYYANSFKDSCEEKNIVTAIVWYCVVVDA